VSKSLESLYHAIPKKVEACRFEQIMTKLNLAEMPRNYKIRSYFDGRDKAKERVVRLMEMSNSELR